MTVPLSIVKRKLGLKAGLKRYWVPVGEVLWISLGASVAAALSSLAESKGAGERIALIPRTALYLIIGTLALSFIITLFVFLIRQRTAHITRLKREVTNAFLKALDASTFNPRRLEERNEQHSLQLSK